MDDRSRIPQDNDYFHAVGLATIAFARLEWNAVWCCERLEVGYIDTLEPKRKTAGMIGNDMLGLFNRVADVNLRARIVPLAEAFRDIVLERNGLMHGKPGTTAMGKQRLFRHGNEWSIPAVNAFSDRCVTIDILLNGLLYNELKEPRTAMLLP